MQLDYTIVKRVQIFQDRVQVWFSQEPFMETEDICKVDVPALLEGLFWEGFSLTFENNTVSIYERREEVDIRS